ncbi:MAG: phosphoribosylformylglycinamidine cyclo-ligase [Deltaproteobacteria bacterium]|nr:phosphoribosylformylglycinamidine cyclo-ligase [Deltaproteobacteria bacterium]
MLAHSITYKDAGVDIDAGNQFVQRIKPLIQKTQRTEVISSLGGYAGLFSINILKYKDPVLVSTTDGVGTKLKLALELGRYKGLGQDLVGMCVNDLLCVGAEPLFFLDYFATGKLDIDIAVEVIEGITECLKNINCTLIGGETAEMPGLYQTKDFDLAGFAVGIVNRGEMIDGSSISIGNKIIGLASSGVHSNGFSLVRKLIQEAQVNLEQHDNDLKQSLGAALLEPTRIYVNSILALKRQFNVLGLAHITGGGLLENPPRIFPKQCKGIFNLKSWERPLLFKKLQAWGNISEEEMLRVFNCGIGMILVVEANQAEEAVSRLAGLGEQAWIIGEIAERNAGEGAVSFVG